MSARRFHDWVESRRAAIESALDRALPPADARPERLHAAMRYSVFAGGKRLRPAFLLLAGESCGATEGALLAPAAAVECIHTYSLVHDDLPALDDDDLRRGRPTLHRAFDEATAILAGDALLTLGLTLLAAEPREATPGLRARAVARLGAAIGSTGMIGGQAEDLAAERGWPADPAAALERIHRGKTAALISTCFELGALSAGAGGAAGEAFAAFGERVGLLFQIRDDILDVEGSAEVLGKTPGKDAERRKLTYPELHGLAASAAEVGRLAAEARSLAAKLPGPPELFGALVDELAARDR